MKIFVVLVISFFLTLTVHAENTLTNNNTAGVVDTTKKPKVQSGDYITMKDGKMMLMKKGKLTIMTQKLVMSDGTTVGTDGKVVFNDGRTAVFSEGKKEQLNTVVVKFQGSAEKVISNLRQ